MKKKPWTVMAYLAGDINLDSAGVTELGEITAAARAVIATIIRGTLRGRSR